MKAIYLVKENLSSLEKSSKAVEERMVGYGMENLRDDILDEVVEKLRSMIDQSLLEPMEVDYDDEEDYGDGPFPNLSVRGALCQIDIDDVLISVIQDDTVRADIVQKIIEEITRKLPKNAPIGAE